MKPIRNIRLPGRGQGRNIPAGYLVGRASRGRGPMELIDSASLGQVGLASAKQVNAQAAQVGFRFFVGGRPAAGEEIGSGNWAYDVLFENGQSPTSQIVSLTPAHASAVWNIKILVAGVYTTIGTITFAAASMVGVLNWPSPVTVPAGVPLSLWAPNPQDSTLASITGTVYGSKA